MPTNKQRREAARRKLERQLAVRQERARRRRRGNIIASVVGAVVVVAVIVAVVIFTGNNKKSNSANSTSGATTSGAGTSATPTPTPSKSYPAAKGAAVSFNGVTVTGATDLAGRPGVTSTSAVTPKTLEFKDLVVGKGTAAQPTSTVTVQYVGALYKNGTIFDESWKRGSPASFSLSGVVKGFTEGIGGTTNVPAMKIGGRRIIILPAALGYGSTAQSAIPANSSLVFVIDLTAVTAPAASPSAT